MRMTAKDSRWAAALAPPPWFTLRPRADGRLSLSVVFLGLALCWTSGFLPGNAVAQQEPSSALVQYNALVQEQLDFLYTDPALMALRVELIQVQLFVLYDDPWFNYLSHDFNSIAQQMYTSHPSYPVLQAWQQEVNSWTVPPDDRGMLEARYDLRAQVQELSAQVEQDTLPFFTTWSDQLRVLGDQLAQLVPYLFSSAEVTTWYHDWASRWQQTFVNSPGSTMLNQRLEQLFRAFPEVYELLVLNQQLMDLQPSLRSHPLVVEASNRVAAVVSDPAVAAVANQYYQQLIAETNALLAMTAYKAETERFLERMNGLIANDPVSQLFTFAQYLAVNNLLILRQSVHDAVANCVALYASSCDPYVDGNVTRWLPSYNLDSLDVIETVGEFYEFYNSFWYQFYRSPTFVALQEEALATLQAALQPVIPSLLDAQARYVHNLQTIPQVSELQQAMTTLLQTLRAQPLAEDSGQFATVGSLVDRMEVLAQALAGGVDSGP